MPTYDYVCDACGHSFEDFQAINDPIKKKCPKCKKSKLRRLFGTGGGIVFKGSGFYITDYRSDSYKKQATAEKGSIEKGGGGERSSGGEKSSGGESKSSGEKKSGGGEK